LHDAKIIVDGVHGALDTTSGLQRHLGRLGELFDPSARPERERWLFVEDPTELGTECFC
jgi:hypothetical protein